MAATGKIQPWEDGPPAIINTSQAMALSIDKALTAMDARVQFLEKHLRLLWLSVIVLGALCITMAVLSVVAVSTALNA